jgi:hypothetical protein
MPCYDNVADLFNALSANSVARSKAGAKDEVPPSVKIEDLHHGDRFISILSSHFAVFGEVVEWIEDDDLQKIHASKDEIRNNRDQGFVCARCYSTETPQGILIKDVPVNDIDAKIGTAVFNRARVNGWLHLNPVN